MLEMHVFIKYETIVVLAYCSDTNTEYPTLFLKLPEIKELVESKLQDTARFQEHLHTLVTKKPQHQKNPSSTPRLSVSQSLPGGDFPGIGDRSPTQNGSRTPQPDHELFSIKEKNQFKVLKSPFDVLTDKFQFHSARPAPARAHTSSFDCFVNQTRSSSSFDVVTARTSRENSKSSSKPNREGSFDQDILFPKRMDRTQSLDSTRPEWKRSSHPFDAEAQAPFYSGCTDQQIADFLLSRLQLVCNSDCKTPSALYLSGDDNRENLDLTCSLLDLTATTAGLPEILRKTEQVTRNHTVSRNEIKKRELDLAISIADAGKLRSTAASKLVLVESLLESRTREKKGIGAFRHAVKRVMFTNSHQKIKLHLENAPVRN